MNPAYRRYQWRCLSSSALYVAGALLATRPIPDHAQASPGIIAISLLPGFAIIGMIWSIGRLLIELDDEYLRALEVRKALIATGVALLVTSVWGLIELFTVVPRLPIFFVFPIWAAGLVVGTLRNKVAGA